MFKVDNPSTEPDARQELEVVEVPCRICGTPVRMGPTRTIAFCPEHKPGARTAGSFEVSTQVRADGTILQETYVPMIQQVIRTVVRTQEEQLRQALLDLGWTPPPDPQPPGREPRGGSPLQTPRRRIHGRWVSRDELESQNPAHGADEDAEAVGEGEGE